MLNELEQVDKTYKSILEHENICIFVTFVIF